MLRKISFTLVFLVSACVTVNIYFPAAAVDRALGQAAAAGRLADRDLASILAHQAPAAGGEPSPAGDQHTLAQGTSGWARHGGQEANR